MSEHEDECEINILDDNDNDNDNDNNSLASSNSGDSEARSLCSSSEETITSKTANLSQHSLAFSITNLLKDNIQKVQHPDTQSFNGQFSSYDPVLYPSVLKVPAHHHQQDLHNQHSDNLNNNNIGDESPKTNHVPMFSPWNFGLDPVLQRSAAAAVFASQVVKDRLSGKLI